MLVNYSLDLECLADGIMSKESEVEELDSLVEEAINPNTERSQALRAIEQLMNSNLFASLYLGACDYQSIFVNAKKIENQGTGRRRLI